MIVLYEGGECVWNCMLLIECGGLNVVLDGWFLLDLGGAGLFGPSLSPFCGLNVPQMVAG